jgi:predicted nuclease of predicted toxin-antitoxin system
MKFLVDAQLPSALCNILVKLDNEAIHVLQLANEDRSTDKEIQNVADSEDHIVITKDSNFYHSHMTIQAPRKLLLISNKVLFELVHTNMAKIENLFKTCDLVELSNNEIVGH